MADLPIASCPEKCTAVAYCGDCSIYLCSEHETPEDHEDGGCEDVKPVPKELVFKMLTQPITEAREQVFKLIHTISTRTQEITVNQFKKLEKLRNQRPEEEKEGEANQEELKKKVNDLRIVKTHLNELRDMVNSLRSPL